MAADDDCEKRIRILADELRREMRAREARMGDEIAGLVTRMSRVEGAAGDATRAADSARDELEKTGAAMINHVDRALATLRAAREIEARDVRAVKEQVDEHGEQLSELAKLLREVRDNQIRTDAEKAAKSQINLESAQVEALTYERAKRRREALTWMLGILFVLAQVLQIVNNVDKKTEKSHEAPAAHP